MTEDSFTLTTFYTFWEAYQERIKRTLEPLTSEQLEVRAAPDLRSIGEIAMHIVSCRAYWFAAFMSDVESSQMKVYVDWNEKALKLGASIPTVTELTQGLDHTWRFMADRLASWSPDDLRHTFPDEWDGKKVDVSRAWVIWHVMEHDLHHGGELSLTLGIHGIPADFPG